MKTNYTTIKIYAMLFFAIATSITTNAQPIEYLNANNLNAGFGMGGTLFGVTPHGAQYSQLEVPKGSGMRSMYAASLWMTGFDATWDVPHCGVQKDYGDFYDGPVVSTYDSLYDIFYHRVFKVTRAQIDMHRSNTFPIHATRIDNALLRWPARGNPYVATDFGVNITSSLAPFVDADGDQIYDPAKGDYPAICGDEAVFMVFNDARGPHVKSNTPNKMNFEIRALAELFVKAGQGFEKQAINNTVFVRYEIENKSLEAYNDFYLGLWQDPDLGCWSNDRVGCDTNRSLMFAYNDGIDADCNGATGYQPYQVAQGTTFLNREMSTFGYFTNGGPSSTTDPSSCMQFIYNMQGLWNDGTPFTNAGNGYNNGPPTRFLFPGDPNKPSEWSEMSAGMYAGDRRMTGSAGPMTFAKGEIKNFDFAFTTAYDSTSTNLQIIDTLKRDADIIQAFYNNNIVACKNQLSVGINEKASEQLAVSIYPNPASDKLYIETGNVPVEQVSIYNTIGGLVSKTVMNFHNHIDISELPNGVYIAEIKIKQATVKKRWVKL